MLRKLLILLVVPLLAACATGASLSGSGLPTGAEAYSVMSSPAAVAVPSEYRISPFDQLSVNVFQEPDLSTPANAPLQVDASGNINMPLLGTVSAGGMTTAQLGSLIAAKLSGRYLKNPQVTVAVADGKGGTASDTVTIQVIRPARKEIVFEDVHFDFDRYSLRPEATRALDEAIRTLQENADLRIEIEGHTCNIGTAEYNLALGDRRARSVQQYLTSNGVAADRMTTVSFGEEQPKFDNSREETRRLNRRAAMTVQLVAGGN